MGVVAATVVLRKVTTDRLLCVSFLVPMGNRCVNRVIFSDILDQL